MRRKRSALVVTAGAAALTAGASADLIDFDGTGAPGGFIQTTALRDLFAGLGVNFHGPDGPEGRDGGAILNQTGNFGVDAHSGTDFFAFNRGSQMMDGGIPRDPATILFDDLQGAVSIWAAGGFDFNTFRMEAFNQFDVLVDIVELRTQNWSLLSVSSDGGIARVVLTELGDGTDDAWVYDDLTFDALPAPGALAVLALAGLRGARRRRP